MRVTPGDVAADHAALLLVGSVVSAVEGEVSQGRELCLYAVEPGAVGRGAGDSTLFAAAQVPTRWHFLVVRCGKKLSQTIAMRVSGGRRVRR